MEGKTGNWWITAAMALFMIGVLLLFRQQLCQWLLPDGSFLESLARQVKEGEQPVAEAVFSQLQEWFFYD